MNGLLISLLLLIQAAPETPSTAKPLPVLAEPPWDRWKVAPGSATVTWQEFLNTWKSEPPEEDKGARGAKVKKLEALEARLGEAPEMACAAGSALLRSSTNSMERLLIAELLDVLSKGTAEPFGAWALSKIEDVDPILENVVILVRGLTSKKNPALLPAAFTILRLRDASIPLILHAWSIPPHDALYYALSPFGQEVTPYLESQLAHADPVVRRNAAMALGQFFADAARPALARMLKAGDLGSGGAAYALGMLGAKEHLPEVIPLLSNPVPRTRFWAAYALYEMDSREAIAPLKEALARETDKDTQQEMEIAIQRLQNGPPKLENAERLSRKQVDEALARSEKREGMDMGPGLSLLLSASREDIPTLDRIRFQTTKFNSDKGHKRFNYWTDLIKEVRRRHPK